jgi:hypothetical protein
LWSDVCELPSGGFVHVVAERFAVAAYSGSSDSAPIWRQPVATDFLRFLRCAVSSGGEIRAIGQGGDGQAWFVGPGVAEMLGPTHGVNPVALRHDGERWVAYVVDRPDRYRMIQLDGEAKEMPMPWSSQGIRDVLPDGTVILGDHTYAGTFEGYGFGEYQRRNGVVVGQHGFGVGVLLEPQRHFFKARSGQTNFGVHMARSTAGLAVCALTEEGAYFAEFAPPFPPHEPVPSVQPPATPVPVPPVMAPQPERPAVTISHYAPASGDAPLEVTATAAITAGAVTTFTWRWRCAGEQAWTQEPPVAATQAAHTFRFRVAGTYEISLRGDGPGGTAETGLRRTVIVKSRQETPLPPPRPVTVPPAGKVAFRTHAGRFLCADLKTPDARLVADRPHAGEWEHFQIERAGPDRVRLRAANRMYVAAEGGGGRELVANRDAPGAWEQFEVVTTDAGYALRAHSGHFVSVSAEGEVRADAGIAGPHELFAPSAPLIRILPIARIAGPLRIDDRFFVNDAGTFRPIFTSALSILRHPDEEMTRFLDWAARTGFNGIRVFAGALKWASQTASGARQRLPFLLAEAAARGLYVEVTAITDSLEGAYDLDEHIRGIARACSVVDNVIVEVANEPYHSTQAGKVHDAATLLALGRHCSGPFALGAASSDESQDMSGGPYITAHLDRGRDKWNQVRRVRELEMLSEHGRKPVLNNEPIGAAETAARGRRESDPAFFFCLGALNRTFEVGGVFHSDAGLSATIPGPVQQACADAFVAGSRVVPVEDRLRFKNAGWVDSPVASARFEDTIVRAYSGVSGARAWTTLVGLSGDPGLQLRSGWSVAGELARHPGVAVLELRG